MSVLTIYVVLLIAVPSQLIIGPLGGAGTPAQVVGLAAFGIWAVARARGEFRPRLHPSIPIAYGIFAAAVLASYISAMVRPIASEEVSTANMGLLTVTSWAGIILIACSEINSKDRLLQLLSRLVTLTAAMAALGIVQFATHRSWVNYLQIPGLSVNKEIVGVGSIDGLTRATGTASDAIEFGVVLAIVLPIAVSLALGRTDRTAWKRWLPVILIAMAIPVSHSRSAIVGSTVALIVLSIGWPGRTRIRALAAVSALVGAVYVTMPGLLGSLTSDFTGIGSDTSAQSRVDAYPIALAFFHRSPIVGRGYSTFLPRYWIFDNQYLGILVEMGAIGIAAILLLFATSVRSAFRASTISADSTLRAVARSLGASVLAGATSLALFDALGFAMSAGTLMLCIGLCGGVFRVCANLIPTDIPDGESEASVTWAEQLDVSSLRGCGGEARL